MVEIGIKDFAVLGDNIDNWQMLKQYINSNNFKHTETKSFCPKHIGKREARRLSRNIKLALEAAETITDKHTLDYASLRTVFSNASGDNDISNYLCQALATKERIISPTQFHNSLHNIPAGYWHIANQATASSVSLSAGQFSFAVGLLEAAIICQQQQTEVLFICYEHVAQEPLQSAIKNPISFASAWYLSPKLTNLNLQLKLTSHTSTTSIQTTSLLPLLAHNPALQSIALLESICNKTSNWQKLAYNDAQSLEVKVSYE